MNNMVEKKTKNNMIEKQRITSKGNFICMVVNVLVDEELLIFVQCFGKRAIPAGGSCHHRQE